MAAIVLPLSFTGGAVSTPAIGRELGGSATSLTWITNAFMLSFGSLLMAAGALADVYGRKRLFSIGIGLAFGPLLGGVLIDAFGWRSVFLSTALIGAAAMLFGVPRMRETRDPNAQGLDWPGTISFTATLVLFTFAVIQAPESGWSSALVAGSLAVSALMLAIFIYIESRSARPMLDLSLFRIPRFVGVQMLPIGTCYSYIVLVVMLPLRFIGIEGLSEIDAGILMIALSAPMLVVPVVVATLTRWVSAGVLSGIGFLIAAVGLHWFSQIDVGAASYAVVGPMLLIGIGAGMPWGLMDGLAVSVVPKERAGMATGIFNTTRVAGEGIALATVSAVLAAIAQVSLSAVLAEAGSTAGKVGEAAQRLATGDLAHAAEALPQVSHQLLVASYGDAFRILLHVLTVITVLSAVAVFGFLSRTPQHAGVPAAEELGSNA